MLNSFRTFQGSFTIKILMGFLILTFAAWGIGDMIRSPHGNGVLATVGGKEISTTAFMREYQAQAANMKRSLGANYSPELLKSMGVENYVLQRLAQKSLLAQEAKELGIVPPDSHVLKAFKQNPIFADQSGKFDKSRFATYLKIQGMSEKTYVEEVRNELATQLLMQSLAVKLTPPVAAVKSVLASNDEKRDVTLYKVSATSLPEPASPKEEELTNYYNNHEERYVSPEYRTVSYATIDANALVAKDAKVTDEAIKAYYNEHLDNYKKPETRDVSQLLYGKEEQAQKAYALMKSGKSFEQIAQEIPPTNKSLSIGKMGKQAMLPDAADTVFALEKGGVTEPIKSPFGFHIFRVNAIQSSGVAPLEDVKSTIASELKQNQQESALTNRTNEIEDALAGGTSLKEVSKQYGLGYNDLGTFNKLGKNQSGTDVAMPQLDKFMDVVFKTDEKSDSNIITSKGGQYYIVHVEKIIPERARPLNEVKQQVTSDWKNEEINSNLARLADATSKKLADAKLHDAATKQPGVSVAATGSIKRSDHTLNDIALPQGLLAELFGSEVGKPTKSYMLKNGDYVIAETNKVILGDNSDTSQAKLAETSQQLSDMMQDELFEEYLRHLENKYPVKLDKRMMAALMQSDER
jgi:peptidyl-prolyl cis-trans isomerase D